MSENKLEVKREMLSGNRDALIQYSRMLHREFLFGENPELAPFAEGGLIKIAQKDDENTIIMGLILMDKIAQKDDENTRRIRNVLKHTYTKYIRTLIQETYDSTLLHRMVEGGVAALTVYQPDKVFVNMAECGIEEDAIHAVWLINTPDTSGYLMTDNYGTSPDSTDGVSEKTLDRLRKGNVGFLDFFEYDSETGMFLKNKENPWGGRELARNLEFHGLISPEHPVSPQQWFGNVLKNLEDALKKESYQTI